ncbi:MAG TPA: hypothetical protein VKA39_02725, partial [Beijerinckiaceae bacterium]|nr:hypothetical protein [Beijerinckiaceae bacterium]
RTGARKLVWEAALAMAPWGDGGRPLAAAAGERYLVPLARKREAGTLPFAQLTAARVDRAPALSHIRRR